MKSLDNIAEDLFNKIRGRFPSVTIGDGNGKVTNDPIVARFFDFDYKEGDRNIGKVSISITEETLAIMYSNSFVENEDDMTRNNWYDFLKELRIFAKKRLLQFDTRDITKSNLDKRDYKFLAQQHGGEQTMSESKMYGTSKISYQDVGNARVTIKHTESVNQELAAGRTQKIGAIYVENTDGERFKYPFKHLNGARAMARHVSEGGMPYDDFGKHVVGLSEELSKLRKFKNYMGRSAVMAESLAGYTDIVKERIATVKKTIESLQKPVYYKETFEAFETPMFEDVPSDVAENWIDQLTIKQFNEELQDVFPYIYKLVGEATKAKELGPEELEEKMTKLQASKYSCEDCGCQMHNCKPDCDCKHDSHDETGSWWKDENGNGIPDVMEGSGLQYHIGVKKHGKEYMDKAAAAGREGASQEELGRLKDRYSKAEKNKTREEIELEVALETTMGQFSDNVCEECGNPSWRLFTEGEKRWKQTSMDPKDAIAKFGKDNVKIKKGGLNNGEDMIEILVDDIEEGERHGNSKIYKKCWKGYSKVPGKTAGEPGSCKKNEDDTDEGNAYSGAVAQAKMNGAEKGDEIDGPDGEKIVIEKDKTPLGEFILSYYDREEGAFPKGETAILTMVEKDYGEQYINPAKSFIEQVQAKFEEFNGYKDPELMDEGDYEEDDLYTVRKGDTVYSLSKQSGTPVGDIIEINGLDDDAAIQAGQQLRVPGINQIGASPATPGATRGIDPKDNYSADDFERLVNQGKNEEFNDIKRLAGL